MSIRLKISKFFVDEGGNIAAIAAISLMSAVICIAATIDFSGLSNRKSDLQHATDAAVLSAAVSGETKKNKLEKIAKSVFEENFTFKEGESLQDFNLVLSNDDEVVLLARLSKPTFFGGVIGKKNMSVAAEAATLLPNATSLDIALVLDRTGSMAGSNMNGLILAAGQFIRDLETSERDVRLAVVPFSDYVNVGTVHANMSWLDLPSTSSFGSNVECSMDRPAASACSSGAPTSGTSSGSSPSTSSSSSSGSSTTTTTTTTSSSGGNTCTTTTTSSSGSSTSSSSCSVTGSTSSGGTIIWSDFSRSSGGGYCAQNTDPQENSGDTIEECVPVRASENWFGCVGSRTAPYNLKAEFDNQKIPLVYDRTCGQAVTKLSSNLTNASQNISSLTASGATYIPGGLIWGWRALEPSIPLESTNDGSRQKLIILMTDGQNTRSQVGSLHAGNNNAAADRFTLELCQAIKSSGIKMATVSYSNGGSSAANSNMLSDCASTPSLYFSAKNPEALRDAFQGAADQVSDVRLIR